MKTLNLIILIFFAFTISNSQTVITYKNHALQAGYEHITQYVTNISPGQAGENQIWDFSDFKCDNTKTSDIVGANETLHNGSFPLSNISIIDEDNYFYFNINELYLEYQGLITPNAVISFDNPIMKMSYPFKFGDKIEDDFSGMGIYYGQIQTDIYGTYSVEADGFGTLILPNDVTIHNVLRVKTINNIFEISCKTTEFNNVKYLWYSEDYRYPIMVITENKKIIDGKETFTNFGYYNEKAFQTRLIETNNELANYSVNVYPNPFTEFTTITYNLPEITKVNISVYNINGQKVQTIVNNQEQEDVQSYIFNPSNNNLAIGTYFIRLQFDKEIIFKKIIMVDRK